MRQHLRFQSIIVVISTSLLVALLSVMSLPNRNDDLNSSRTRQSIISLAKRNFRQLPVRFERQSTNEHNAFVARGQGFSLTLSAADATLRVMKRNSDRWTTSSATIGLKLIHANTAPRVEALEPLPGQINYLFGNDHSQWRTGIKTFGRVKQHAVYPGVDLVWYGNQGQLEYDFVVAPGADPSVIKLVFTGAESIQLDDNGDLLLQTSEGTIRQQRPLVYQEADGQRHQIESGYKLSAIRNQEVSFQIGEYDSRLPLVIDPILVYSTFLGSGSDFDSGTDIAIDAAGNAYVTGFTDAMDFPTERALQKDFRSSSNCGDRLCPDVFVVKLTPSGSGFVYATYLGGDDADTGSSIFADANGNAYVTGSTFSANFPTNRPFQNSLRLFDAFLAKLSPDGSSLVYSTFFGGNGFESGTGVTVDAAGNAYLCGTTIGSADFPTRNAFQTSPGGGTCQFGESSIPCPDAFVAKFNASGNALLYSTFLGGNRFDTGAGIAIDANNQVVITGSTSSTNFPTRNAAQSSFGGTCDQPDICFDAYVTKLSADGSSLVFSTYLGGKAETNPIDVSNGIATDAAGNTVVTGTTFSTDFPLKNPVRTSINITEAFVTKFDQAGAIVYSTYLGGSGVENFFQFQFSILSIIGQGYSSNSIAVDAAGNAYVAGMTDSSDFPTLNPVQPRIGGGQCDTGTCPDAFITKFSPAGALLSSTFLGGDNIEIGLGIAADSTGNVFATGLTASPGFPTANPKQRAINGAADLFISKIGEVGTPAIVTSVSAASFVGPQLAPESIVSAFGTNLAATLEIANTTPLPTTLAGTTVTIRDVNGTERLAPLFFVAPTQINYQITPGTPAGPATVTVTNSGGQVSRGSVQIATTAPGMFSADASGKGFASAVALRVRNGQQTFEPVIRFDSAANRIVAVPIDLGPETDQVFLIAYGTGIRLRLNASALIGGAGSEVLFSGPSSFIGVDQINLRIPRSLGGRGEVDVVLTADGKMTNPVRIVIR